MFISILLFAFVFIPVYAESTEDARPYVWEIKASGLKKDGASVNIVGGERLQLDCTVSSTEPVEFKWYRGKKEGETKDEIIDETEEHINITSGVNVSSLVIVSVENGDRAYYNCSAKNEFGNSSQVVLVRIKGKLDPLWPFLGIVGEVVILCTIICLYENSRKKPDFTESETEISNEGKSSSAIGTEMGKSEEIRQRK